MSANSLPIQVKKHAAWSIFMGVLTAVFGAFLIVYPLFAAKVTTVLLGWMMILVGIAEFVLSLHSRGPGGFLTQLLRALVFGATGAALVRAPMAGVQALTGLLGTLLLVQAGLATITAFQIRPLAGWGWFLADAGTSLALGLLILIEWPSSSVWAIGILVGGAVLMGGIVRIIFATKIRIGARTPEAPSTSGAGISNQEQDTHRLVS